LDIDRFGILEWIDDYLTSYQLTYVSRFYREVALFCCHANLERAQGHSCMALRLLIGVSFIDDDAVFAVS